MGGMALRQSQVNRSLVDSPCQAANSAALWRKSVCRSSSASSRVAKEGTENDRQVLGSLDVLVFVFLLGNECPKKTSKLRKMPELIFQCRFLRNLDCVSATEISAW